MDNKRKVEAILFALAKEAKAEDLSRLCSISIFDAEKAVQELIEEYEHSNGSLRVVPRENGWKMSVKDEFMPLVSGIIKETELDKGLMETLAVIAWKYPITQAEVIKLRHSKAYEHLKQLMEMGFIAKEKSGRTYKIKLGQKFFEYFDLPSKEAKEAFKKMIPEEMRKDFEEIAAAVKEIQTEEEKKMEIKNANDVRVGEKVFTETSETLKKE
ncbi:SMC-Scp complex subunit ScpB [Candidatus Woesearchaeota archaeon]|nr:SMC-Scp complex subunit ScpB [Candidatus Woesearchaeota archaeon]